MPPMTPQEIMADPKFRALSAMDRIHVLSTVDPSFADLSPNDRMSVVTSLDLPARQVPGTVANTAAARLNLSRGGDTSLPIQPYVPQHDTPGYWGSLAGALGIPTSTEELKHFALTGGFSGQVPGALQVMNTAAGLHNAKGFQGVNRVLNPAALPMEQIGDENYAGAAGTLTPTAAALAAGTEPGGRAVSAAGRLAEKAVPAISSTGYGLAGVAKRLPNVKVNQPVSILSEPIKGFGEGWRARPVPVPLSSVTEVPPTVPSRLPSQVGTDFPMNPATPARLPIADGPVVSPPVNTPEQVSAAGNWAGEVNKSGRPAELTGTARLAPDGPVAGDAPNQPLIRPRKIGKDFDPRTESGGFAPRKSIPLVGDASSAPSGKSVSWTDRTGTIKRGTVSTTVTSKNGPAHIVVDEAGKSRFVLKRDIHPPVE